MEQVVVKYSQLIFVQKIMKSSKLPSGQLLSDKFVSYFELNHRPTSSKKRIKAGTLKKTNQAAVKIDQIHTFFNRLLNSTLRSLQLQLAQLQSHNKTRSWIGQVRSDKALKLFIARPFSKNSTSRPPTATATTGQNQKKQQRKPQFSAKKSFRFTASDIQEGKNNPFIESQGSKENFNTQSQNLEDDVFQQIGNSKLDDALMPRISQEQYSTRSKIALELQKHQLNHNILRADLDFQNESNAEVQQLSQRFIEQMKMQRKDQKKVLKKINSPSKESHTQQGFQKLDNIIKLGNELILYQQADNKENHQSQNVESDEGLKIQDETHSSTMKRIYQKISQFKKNAQCAKDLAEGMMGDIQNLKEFNGAPMIRIPQNFQQIISIAGEEVREEILRNQAGQEQQPYSQFKTQFEGKAQSFKKKLPLWSKYIKVTPQTILDPLQRAKQQKIIKQLGKIQKQEAKLAEYRKEQRRKKLQTREQQLNSASIQDLSPIKKSRRNNQQIIDHGSDTFLTNLIKPSQQKAAGNQQLVSIPQQNISISTQRSLQEVRQLPASFKKPNIRTGSAKSASNISHYSSASKKDFITKNIQTAFTSEKGHTYAMKNLNDQERERMNQLLGQIQSESQTLSQIKNEIAIERRERENSSHLANSRISDIQQDRKTILSLANYTHRPDTSNATALSIVKSTISNRSSIQNEEEFQRIQTINQSLRAIVPIDKWESCSINPSHNNGLSTIKDIESGASSFTGRGVSKYGSEFSQNARSSLLNGIQASRKLPKEKFLKQSAQRRIVDGKLRDIDQNIARLIGQGIDLDISNEGCEKIEQERIKRLVQECKISGAGGVGGPLDVIKQQDLNEKGVNAEMSIILFQEEILKQANILAQRIQKNIQSSEQGILAIEVINLHQQLSIQAESNDVIDKNLQQNIQKINQIEENSLNNKIENYDKLLGEKKELVKKLQDSQNLLKQLETGIEISAQKFKQQQLALQQSQQLQQSLMKNYEQIQQLGEYQGRDYQDQELIDLQKIQQEAAQLMKSQKDINIQRDAEGEINLQNLIQNMSEIQICPIFRP